MFKLDEQAVRLDVRTDTHWTPEGAEDVAQARHWLDGLRSALPERASVLAGISAAGASIVTINQSTPENGAALVAVTIRTDTMQMTPEELTEKLSRQRMVVGVHCGYNL